MSETASQEPTMEEILASIRRIISEDDAPPLAGAEPEAEAATSAPESEPEAEPGIVALSEPEPEPMPEVEAAFEAIAPLAPPAPPPIIPDLEDDLELTEKVETQGDLDILPVDTAPPPPPMLVSETVAAAAAASFGHLSATIAMPASERTLEDVVRSLLTPLLQQWLDANLPGIVQEAVQAEVDRIARSRVR